jgi:hypothetical protein
MAEVSLEFVLERLQRLQAEQAEIRQAMESWRGELRDAIAGFRDEMAVQTGLTTRAANGQTRIERQIHNLQDTIDRYLTQIIASYEGRIAKLEQGAR